MVTDQNHRGELAVVRVGALPMYLIYSMEVSMAVTGRIVVRAFDLLGGDPSKAAKAAERFTNVKSWVRWQTTQAAVAGAGALAIPAFHLVGIGADVAFVMHKMAYCAWGIGKIMGAPPYGKPDLAIILALWSEAIEEKDLPAFIAVSMVEGALAEELVNRRGSQASERIASYAALHEQELTEGRRLIQAGAGLSATSLGKTMGRNAGITTGAVVRRYGTRIAGALAPKIVSKAIGGFVPVLGPVIGAGINTRFLSTLADSAESYYAQRLRQERAMFIHRTALS
jgi:hypothetical protein